MQEPDSEMGEMGTDLHDFYAIEGLSPPFAHLPACAEGGSLLSALSYLL